jgi:glycosyltransferase involved in cell wall biosynthesis
VKQGVSIIICFYNGGLKLGPTIQHLLSQSGRNPMNTELILVNNGSTDDSESRVKSVLQKIQNFDWKIVNESKPGLANARLCGLKHAAFDLLLYCDDDNWLSPDYLEKGEAFLRTHPDVAILGGKGTATSTIPIPFWFEKHQNYYAVGPQMAHSGRVYGKRHMVYGAGMFIRKKSFETLLDCGFAFQSLGRTGKNLSAGEDSELCLAIQLTGQHVWYLEDLHFQHFMEPYRLEKNYLKKLQKGMNYSGFYGRFYRDFLFGYVPKVTRFFWLKEIGFTIIDACKQFVRLNFKLERHFKLIQFILRERSTYNARVNAIIRTCKLLKARA